MVGVKAVTTVPLITVILTVCAVASITALSSWSAKVNARISFALLLLMCHPRKLTSSLALTIHWESSAVVPAEAAQSVVPDITSFLRTKV
jgi:hypothetical protein